jgi:RimJ/RimL family protein N-acetyltransferase
MNLKLIRKKYSDEIAYFERQAGDLPKAKSAKKYEDIGAVWVISGGGSYLSEIIDAPSDRVYAKKRWYPNQDKQRLDYAKAVLDALDVLWPKSRPKLIYNGTRKQNFDLRKAIEKGLFKFPKSRLYVAPGKITKTLEQVEKFSFPPDFKPGKMKLGVLSHSAHLSRILRFMNRFAKKFKGVRVVPLSTNVSDYSGEHQMAASELDNLLGYISRKEAPDEPYPFIVRKDEKIEILPVEKEDSNDVLALSNHDSVRKASFNPKKISPPEHKKWFAGKIRDKNTIFLKATHLGEFAGQVRLEIEAAKAVLSISVDERHRGKGIASMLVKAAIAVAKRKKLSRIEALTKSDNPASQKLLEKNGFIFKGEKNINGIDARKYFLVLR